MTRLVRAAEAFELLAAGKPKDERQRIARDVLAILIASEVKRL